MISPSAPGSGRINLTDTRGVSRSLAAVGFDFAREGGARALLAPRRRGRGPMAVFLPAGPPEGAALLRIYNMAEALRPLGWPTAVLPWRLTLAARRRYLAAACPDVVVMQGSRHALNRPELYSDWPVVYDIDDADFHLDHLAAPVTEAMGHVSAVIAGSRYIADWARANGAGQAHVIWTGTPVSARPRPAQGLRPPVVAWAQTRPMSYTREAALVARVMARVAAARPGATLRLYDRRPDDDPAFAERFRAPGLTVEWRETCRYSDYLASFDDVAVGLAPLCPETPFSRGKSFGKVLAYLDRKVPVVGSAAGEHGAFFCAGTGVICNSLETWAESISTLLDAPGICQDQADRAFEAFTAQLSVEAAATAVSDVLAGVADTRSVGGLKSHNMHYRA